MKSLNTRFSALEKLSPKYLRKMNPTVSVILTGLLVFFLTAPFITGYMMVATANFFLLLTGFTLRHKNRDSHAAFMVLAVVSDLLLVLVLQFQRDAIQTAVAFKLSALNQAHIFTSTAAAALYIPMVIIGISLIKQTTPTQNTTKRTLHRRIGWTVMVFRTLGFFLMFSMLGHLKNTA